MSGNHKKVCRALNYFEYFLVFVSAVSGCVSITVFASLAGVPVGIANSAVGLKICALTAGIIEFLVSKALINSFINNDEFFSVNNVLREYNELKEEIKNPKNAVEYTIEKNEDVFRQL